MRRPQSFLQLFVQCPADDILSFRNVNSSTSVRMFKSQLELRTGVLGELQHLYLSDLLLEDDATLSGLRILNGSLLSLKIKEKSLSALFLSALTGDDIKLCFAAMDGFTCTEQSNMLQASTDMAATSVLQVLFLVSLKGQVHVLTELLKNRSAMVNMTSRHGRTVLHVAASGGNEECVSLLLERGVDAMRLDEEGKSAQEVALHFGHFKTEKTIWLHCWKMDYLENLARESILRKGRPQSQRIRSFKSTAPDKSERLLKLPSLENQQKDRQGSYTDISRKISEKRLCLPRFKSEKIIERSDNQEPHSARHIQTHVASVTNTVQSTRVTVLPPEESLVKQESSIPMLPPALPAVNKPSSAGRNSRTREAIAWKEAERTTLNIVLPSASVDEDEAQEDYENEESTSEMNHINLETNINHEGEIARSTSHDKADRDQEKKAHTAHSVDDRKMPRVRRPHSSASVKLCGSRHAPSKSYTGPIKDKREFKGKHGKSLTWSLSKSKVAQKKQDRCGRPLEEKDSSNYLREAKSFRRPRSADMNLEEARRSATGLSFDQWREMKTARLKTDGDDLQGERRMSNLSTKQPRASGRSGMSFDVWLSWKREQAKARISSRSEGAQSEMDRSKYTGLPYEKWLHLKERQREVDSAERAKAMARREYEQTLIIEERMNNPRLKTFEEWLAEKTRHIRHELKSERRRKYELAEQASADDDNIIFNMWMADKHAKEMEEEKKRFETMISAWQLKNRKRLHRIVSAHNSSDSDSSVCITDRKTGSYAASDKYESK